MKVGLMTYRACPRIDCRAPARGYTLIELIIALGLGVVIMLGLMLLFSRGSGNQQELDRTVRQIENARFAVDTLTEDVMHAGFFSDFNPDAPGVAATYTSPTPCADLPGALGWDSAASPVQVPRPVDGIPAATAFACLGDRRANTEAIVVRRAETGPTILWGAGTTNNLYIQTARCGSEAGQIRVAAVPLANPESTFNLLAANCTPLSTNNALRRLLQRTYYVATCNDCAGAGDGIPTLKRVELIDGELRTTAIAEGVENLQFEYGVDNTDADGVPDDWMTTGAVTAADDWPNVVAVRMHVLTRSTQPTPGHVETRTYRLGPSVAICGPDRVDASCTPVLTRDGFKRTLLSATVRLNNVGGRRE
jgi:type IV pilus assembly protein PilW